MNRYYRNNPGNGDADGPSIDFERLCRSIDRTVAQISQAVGQGLGDAGEAIGSAINEAVEKGSAARARKAAAAAPVVPHSSAQQATPVVNFNRYAPPTAAKRKRYRSTAGLSVSGGAMAALGGLGVLSFGGAALLSLASPALFAFSGVPATGLFAGGIACAGIAALSAWLLASGVKRLGIASRFNAVKRVLGNREACSFDELAAQLHQSKKRTIADARKMMRYGLLPEGHIDDEGTALMTTNDSYRLYRQAQREYRRSIAEKRAAKAAEAQRRPSADLPAEAQLFARTAEAHLQRIRELDASIADAAVSAKVSSIEDVISRMIERVKDEPSVIGSLDKLADYYLPTTIKLLEAYDDLEKQPVQGRNIAGSREEIELTLDVLRSAYEKLLDETYRDMSLDVSADISVLHAVLAQEGLAKSPFDEDPERTERDDR